MGYLYQFDWRGRLPENRAEKTFTIPAVSAASAYCVIPPASPFFESSVVVTDKTGKVLTKGVDYLLGHPFSNANGYLDENLYGSIIFSTTGSLDVTTSTVTVGGPYATEAVANLAPFTNDLATLLSQDWGSLVIVVNSFDDPNFKAPMSEADQKANLITGVRRFAQNLISPYGRLSVERVNDFTMTEVNEQLVEQKNLVAAISGHDSTNAFYHENICFGPRVVSALGTQNAAEWFDTGLFLQPQQSGWYIVDWVAEARLLVIKAGTSSFREPRWIDKATDSSGNVFPLTWNSVVHTRNGLADLTWDSVSLMSDSDEVLVEYSSLNPDRNPVTFYSRYAVNGLPVPQSCCNGARVYLHENDIVSLQGYVPEAAAANIIINDADHKTSLRLIKIA